MSRYEVISVVGEGAYGVVLKCKHKDTGETVAIKRFKESEENEVVRKTMLREVRILRMMKHENIVQLKEAFRRKGKLNLVFEFVAQSMMDVLEANPDGVDHETVRWLIFQLIRAIKHCHGCDVIHRDIKPENLLIYPQDSGLRLCDFGFARTVCPGTPLTDYVATRWYRTPELLLGATDYGKDVDMWATGCIIGELTDGRPLFPGETEIDQLYVIQRMLGHLTPEHQRMFLVNDRFQGAQFPDLSRPETLEKRYYRHMPKVQLQVLTSLIVMEPKDRVSAKDALRMQWFRGLRQASDGAATTEGTTPEQSASFHGGLTADLLAAATACPDLKERGGGSEESPGVAVGTWEEATTKGGSRKCEGRGLGAQWLEDHPTRGEDTDGRQGQAQPLPPHEAQQTAYRLPWEDPADFGDGRLGRARPLSDGEERRTAAAAAVKPMRRQGQEPVMQLLGSHLPAGHLPAAALAAPLSGVDGPSAFAGSGLGDGSDAPSGGNGVSIASDSGSAAARAPSAQRVEVEQPRGASLTSTSTPTHLGGRAGLPGSTASLGGQAVAGASEVAAWSEPPQGMPGQLGGSVVRNGGPLAGAEAAPWRGGGRNHGTRGLGERMRKDAVPALGVHTPGGGTASSSTAAVPLGGLGTPTGGARALRGSTGGATGAGRPAAAAAAAAAALAAAPAARSPGGSFGQSASAPVLGLRGDAEDSPGHLRPPAAPTHGLGSGAWGQGASGRSVAGGVLLRKGNPAGSPLDSRGTSLRVPGGLVAALRPASGPGTGASPGGGTGLPLSGGPTRLGRKVSGGGVGSIGSKEPPSRQSYGDIRRPGSQGNNKPAAFASSSSPFSGAGAGADAGGRGGGGQGAASPATGGVQGATLKPLRSTEDAGPLAITSLGAGVPRGKVDGEATHPGGGSGIAMRSGLQRLRNRLGL